MSLKGISELLRWHIYIGRGEAQDQTSHGGQPKQQLHCLLPLQIHNKLISHSHHPQEDQGSADQYLLLPPWSLLEHVLSITILVKKRGQVRSS